MLEKQARQFRPIDFVPERAVPPDYLEKYDEFKSSIHIEPGELILWSYISTTDERNSFSQGLNTEYDMRLIAISVDEVKSIAGHIQQNDIVDVLWTGSVPGAAKKGAPNLITKVLLERVTIAAVGPATTNLQQGYGSSGTPTSVTLKLSQKEAALLTFAESVGNVRLILSHQNVLPKDIKDKKEGVDVGYENLQKSKTISATRQKWIQVIYGTAK